MNGIRPNLAIPLAILLCLSLAGPGFAQVPAAVEGVMDLRQWDFDSQGTVELDGEFEFYWGQHIEPRELRIPVIDGITYQSVPDSWVQPQQPATGYATYRLNILIPAKEEYALRLPDFSSSYRLYVDGEQRVEVGVPGISRTTTSARFYPTTVTFTPTGPRVELVFHVSNFHYRTGGLWLSTTFGPADEIVREIESARSIDLILFGAILMMGLYNIVLFTLRPADKAGLFLGLFCIVLSGRMLAVGERVLTRLTDLPFDTYVRLEYISWYLSIATFAGFLRCVMPGEFKQVAAITIYVVVGAATLLTLATPPETLSQLVAPMQLLTIVCQIYAIWTFSLGLARKREGTYVLAIAYLALLVASVNDILVSNAMIDGIQLLGPSLFIFVLTQSILISYRFSQSFKLIATQREQLEATNISLRTQEKLRLQAESASEKLLDHEADSKRLSDIKVLFSLISSANQAANVSKEKLIADLQMLLVPPDDKSPVNINKLVMSALADHHSTTLELAEGLPDPSGSWLMMQRLLENFLGYIATPDESGLIVRTQLETDKKSFFYGSINAGQYIVLSIINSSQPVESLELELLLEPVGHTVNTDIGFGMYVVRNLAKDIGGAINVFPNEGSGYVFELYLPVENQSTAK